MSVFSFPEVFSFRRKFKVVDNATSVCLKLIKRRTFFKIVFMKNITPELAEILGLLCAEGCHVISYSSYWVKERGKLRYRKNKKSERIEFYNKDKKLLVHYQELLFKEFGYESKITKHGKINIGKLSIIQHIGSHTILGHLKWRVPSLIMNSTKHVQIAFIRGYFDGDGTASGRIRFFSTNELGLKQVSQLLKKLNITHTLQGPIFREKRKPSYIIQVSEKEKERFLNLVQPVSKVPG